MANSGPPGFYGGSEGEMGFQSYPNTGTAFDPTRVLDNMSKFTQINSQLHGQLAGTSNQPINFVVPSSSDQANINTQRTATLKTTMKKRETDKAYRDRKKEEDMELRLTSKKLQEENDHLKKMIKRWKHGSNNETLQYGTNKINQQESDIDKLRSNEKQERLLSVTISIKQCNIFIDTQKNKPFEHLINELYQAGRHIVIDDDDSGDENDDSKNKKRRAAHSAPSGRLPSKLPKLEVMDELMETPQVTFAAKKDCYDARAGTERQRSTSNPTAKATDPYSVTECLRILKSMGIAFPAARNAITKFESSHQSRETFVELPEDWRGDWLKEQEKDA